MNMKKIIVHGGRAHLDDVFASALAMAKKGSSAMGDQIPVQLEAWNGPLPIERRDPTQEELDDPYVLCLDVGGSYDPYKSNFDHHQLPRTQSDCAMSLIAKHIRVPRDVMNALKNEPCETFAEFMPKIVNWWRNCTLIDQYGPYVAARESDMEWDTISPFQGPLSAIYLKMFEDENLTPEARGQLVYSTVTKWLEEKIEAWFDIDYNLDVHHIDGVSVMDFTACNPRTCEDASAAFTAKRKDGVAIFIARPRREGENWETTGLTLMRINDDPRIDFNRVKDVPGVKFVHSGGFLCQMEGRDLNRAYGLIRAAVA